MDEKQSFGAETSAPTIAPTTNETKGEPATTEEFTPVEPEQKSGMKKAIIVLIVIALVAGLGYYVYTTKYSDGGPVAIVNDFKIARDEFNKSVELITQNAALQGADVTSAEVKSEINKQALNLLVSNALLLEGARAAGHTASDEEVQAKWDALVVEVGDAETLNTRIAEAGLTEKKLRSNIEERVIVDAYLAAETNLDEIVISDEEVRTAYDSYEASGIEIPPFEEVKEFLRGQILGERQQEVVNDFIETLRAAATIEVKI